MKTQRTTHGVLGLILLTAALRLAAEDVQVSKIAVTTAPPPTLVRLTASKSEAATAPTADTPRLSPWTREILKLAQAGIEEGVMFSFIENSGTFNLGADQIIHLKSVGVSSDVITAMLQHDSDLASGARQMTATTLPPLDPALQKILAALPEMTAERPSVAAPSPSAAEGSSLPESSQPETMTTLGSTLTTDLARPAPAIAPITDPRLLGTPSPSPGKTATRIAASAYRVPETRSVELVPPILVFYGASPTPNLVVIEMFPSSR